MTPDSPVSALWPGGEGGLTGARAVRRLETAGITTVGELLGRDAQDILAIPRAGNGVLAEIRRALTAAGLSLALDPRPSLAQQREAKTAGMAIARARTRERARREEPPPATAEDFAALTADLRAELAGCDPQRRRRLFARLETPRSFTGRPWAWVPVGPSGAAALTGYTAASIRAYKARAGQERAAGTETERTMPPVEDKDRKWAAGYLALWVATRNEGQAAGYAAGPERQREEHRGSALIPATRSAAEALRERDGQVTYLGLARELGVDYRTAVGRAAMAGIRSDLEQERAGDAEVSAFLAAQLARTRRYQPLAVLMGALHGAGIPAQQAQVKRLLPGLRAAAVRQAQKPTGIERARGESLHPQGWLYAAQVAEDWGVTQNAIASAIREGQIRVEDRSHGKRWIDPARLRARTDRRRTPVDVSHPLARLEPGDPGCKG
jgi:hypothetical protein